MGVGGGGYGNRSCSSTHARPSSSAVDTLDRTGQFQEAARLLNAADSGFANRFGIPAREDMTTLRDIVRRGGLSGLLTRVKTARLRGSSGRRRRGYRARARR